jgi:glutaminase
MTREDPETYVSTGDLPPPETVAALVRVAYDKYRSDSDGEVSTVYPALAHAVPDLFGLSVVGTNGAVYSAGDAEAHFALMSVAKPFVFALVSHELGWEVARAKVGVNATGLPFNSLEAISRSDDGRTNPMVNAGAIATTSLAAGGTHEERWRWILAGLSGFAGRALALDEEVYASASETNHRNRSIAVLLAERDRLYCEPGEALDLYTRQSSVSVCARDLGIMGATLADGGVNPVTGERIVGESACRQTLAVMATAGLYETSGDWLYDVGLPGKSGIGGGIVTVSPGKGALGTFGPRLDPAGNSVKGVRAAQFLSRRLGLNLFASASGPSAG